MKNYVQEKWGRRDSLVRRLHEILRSYNRVNWDPTNGGNSFPLNLCEKLCAGKVWANEIHLFVAFQKSCAKSLAGPEDSSRITPRKRGALPCSPCGTLVQTLQTFGNEEAEPRVVMLEGNGDPTKWVFIRPPLNPRL